MFDFFKKKMRNRQAQSPQSFSSHSSSNTEYIILFPYQPQDHNTPYFISMYSLKNTTTVIIRDMNHQDLINKILAFTLSVMGALFASLGEQTLRTKPIVEAIIFFLIVAFSTSLAITFSSHKEGKAVLLLQCVAVISTALVFASIASLFLRVRFQIVAYGFCVFAPLYTVVFASITQREWLFQKVAKAIKRWWTRTISGNYRSSRGQMVIPY